LQGQGGGIGGEHFCPIIVSVYNDIL
jgi:hypothetical protein